MSLGFPSDPAAADPAAPEAPAAPATPAAPSEPAKAPEAPAPAAAQKEYPEFVKMLADLQDRFEAKERAENEANAAKVKAARERELAKLLPEGNLDKVKAFLEAREAEFEGKLTAKEQALADLQTRFQKTTLSNAVAAAVTNAGIAWTSGAAGTQAVGLLEGRAEVAADGSVREKGTGRSLDEMVAALIPTDEFRHFVASSARGKGGTGNGSAASPTPRPGGARTFEEILSERIAADEAAAQAKGLWRTAGLGRRN